MSVPLQKVLHSILITALAIVGVLRVLGFSFLFR